MQFIRILEMPCCRMVTLGEKQHSSALIQQFEEWCGSLPSSLYPKDFMVMSSLEITEHSWMRLYEEGMEVPSDFSMEEFPEGLYAVVTEHEDIEIALIEESILQFLEESFFVIDENRAILKTTVSPSRVAVVMGYTQVDYFFPIMFRDIHELS